MFFFFLKGAGGCKNEVGGSAAGIHQFIPHTTKTRPTFAATTTTIPRARRLAPRPALRRHALETRRPPPSQIRPGLVLELLLLQQPRATAPRHGGPRPRPEPSRAPHHPAPARHGGAEEERGEAASCCWCWWRARLLRLLLASASSSQRGCGGGNGRERPTTTIPPSRRRRHDRRLEEQERKHERGRRLG